MIASPPVIDLYYRTYFRDLRWLHVSLLSVARFVEGYRRIVVVMPQSSAQRLMSEQIPDPARTTLVYCDDYADDYIGQQVSKLYADCETDAAIITHLDSDCVFHSPCNMADLVLDDGRPIIRVATRTRRPASDGWRRCIDDLHGRPLPFDPLTPAPWTYARDLYAALRGTCQQRHRIALDAWCLGRRCDTVSEFSLLAAQAWFHHRDEYRWIAVDSTAAWPCAQYWSRSPRADEVRAELADQLTAT